jgi:hypothetical protein
MTISLKRQHLRKMKSRTKKGKQTGGSYVTFNTAEEIRSAYSGNPKNYPLPVAFIEDGEMVSDGNYTIRYSVLQNLDSLTYKWNKYFPSRRDEYVFIDKQLDDSDSDFKVQDVTRNYEPPGTEMPIKVFKLESSPVVDEISGFYKEVISKVVESSNDADVLSKNTNKDASNTFFQYVSPVNSKLATPLYENVKFIRLLYTIENGKITIVSIAGFTDQSATQYAGLNATIMKSFRYYNPFTILSQVQQYNQYKIVLPLTADDVTNGSGLVHQIVEQLNNIVKEKGLDTKSLVTIENNGTKYEINKTISYLIDNTQNYFNTTETQMAVGVLINFPVIDTANPEKLNQYHFYLTFVNNINKSDHEMITPLEKPPLITYIVTDILPKTIAEELKQKVLNSITHIASPTNVTMQKYSQTPEPATEPATVEPDQIPTPEPTVQVPEESDPENIPVSATNPNPTNKCVGQIGKPPGAQYEKSTKTFGEGGNALTLSLPDSTFNIKKADYKSLIQMKFQFSLSDLKKPYEFEKLNDKTNKLELVKILDGLSTLSGVCSPSLNINKKFLGYEKLSTGKWMLNNPIKIDSYYMTSEFDPIVFDKTGTIDTNKLYNVKVTLYKDNEGNNDNVAKTKLLNFLKSYGTTTIKDASVWKGGKTRKNKTRKIKKNKGTRRYKR